jgi:1-acyl-sn-glycerol-3-phosphate acyltransferase
MLKFARSITSIIRWVIGGFYFFLIASLVFIGLIFVKPQKLNLLVKPLCKALLTSIGVRIKVSGLDLFDHNHPYLIVCNHESLLDPFVCTGYFPMFFAGIELDEHFSWPIWGRVTRKWGSIPISKANHFSIRNSFKKAENVLKHGTSILIFPEGERTITGKLNEFKVGTFYLAKKVKADILPVSLSGLYLAKTRGIWYINSANVNLNFGKPILFEDYKSITVGELRSKVQNIIENLKKGIRNTELFK